MDGFLQIKLEDNNEDKEGFETLEQVLSAVDYLANPKNQTRIKLSGLMGIGKPGDISAFEKLRYMRDEICQAKRIEKSTLGLSMGMSDDYREAILQGSTCVRVGSTIFGSRNSKNE